MASKDVLDFNDHNFEREVLESRAPVLVDFWAEWCGPCRMLSPTIDEVAAEWKGRAKVGKVNVDDNPVVAQRYKVMSIPTVMVFSGGRPVGTLVGVQPKKRYTDALAQAAGA